MEDPYLPGSITVRVMNTYPEFTFSVRDENSVTPDLQKITRDPNNTSQ